MHLDRWIVLPAIVVALVGAAAIAGKAWPSTAEPQPVAPSGTYPVTDLGAGLAHFDGGSWGFDYPSHWRFYPIADASTSFFTILGYLSTQPIDTAAMCQRTPNSASCNFNRFDLAPGNVVVKIASWGMPMVDPLGFYLNPDDGEPTTVGGAPAIRTAALGAESLTMGWKIMRTDAMDNWTQIDATIRGPGSEALGTQVNAIIGSFTASQPLAAIDLTRAHAVAANALQELRTIDGDEYRCFPPPGGQEMDAVLTNIFGSLQAEPLRVRCSTTIAATAIGLWELDLVVEPLSPTNQRQVQALYLDADGRRIGGATR